MNDSLFIGLKQAVAQWLNDIGGRFKSKNISVETATDTEECLYVILNFGECMAAVVVTKPDFAPYRFVSFEAMDIVDGVHEMIYSWYDEEGNTIEDITRNLDTALDVVWEYNNSKGTASV
ncbi:hypothetical protein D3C81_1319410 [compost metagenome]